MSLFWAEGRGLGPGSIQDKVLGVSEFLAHFLNRCKDVTSYSSSDSILPLHFNFVCVVTAIIVIIGVVSRLEEIKLIVFKCFVA